MLKRRKSLSMPNLVEMDGSADVPLNTHEQQAQKMYEQCLQKAKTEQQPLGDEYDDIQNFHMQYQRHQRKAELQQQHSTSATYQQNQAQTQLQAQELAQAQQMQQMQQFRSPQTFERPRGEGRVVHSKSSNLASASGALYDEMFDMQNSLRKTSISDIEIPEANWTFNSLQHYLEDSVQSPGDMDDINSMLATGSNSRAASDGSAGLMGPGSLNQNTLNNTGFAQPHSPGLTRTNSRRLVSPNSLGQLSLSHSNGGGGKMYSNHSSGGLSSSMDAFSMDLQSQNQSIYRQHQQRQASSTNGPPSGPQSTSASTTQLQQTFNTEQPAHQSPSYSTSNLPRRPELSSSTSSIVSGTPLGRATSNAGPPVSATLSSSSLLSLSNNFASTALSPFGDIREENEGEEEEEQRSEGKEQTENKEGTEKTESAAPLGRKEMHVISEKKRREAMREKYAELIGLIPSCDEKTTKLDVLGKAADYIAYVKEKIDKAKQEHDMYVRLVEKLGPNGMNNPMGAMAHPGEPPRMPTIDPRNYNVNTFIFGNKPM